MAVPDGDRPTSPDAGADGASEPSSATHMTATLLVSREAAFAMAFVVLEADSFVLGKARNDFRITEEKHQGKHKKADRERFY